MNINYDKIMIEVNREEAIEIYYALKRGVERAIREHWRNNNADFERQENTLPLLKTLAPFIGQDYADELKYFNALLTKERKEWDEEKAKQKPLPIKS